MSIAVLQQIAYLGLDLVGVAAILYGILNITATRLRPHHHDFLGPQVPAIVVRFTLKALKIIGLLLIAYGITVICLTSIPLPRGERWAWILLGVINIGVLPLLTAITFSISRRAPWWISAAAFVVFLCSWLLLTPAIY